MKNVHFAIPEIYGDTLSYYGLLRKLVDKVNELIDNYNTVPEQIAEEVKNLDASHLFSESLNQLIHSIATDNTKSTNAVKAYKKHDLLYATFNETVNLYESLIDFTTGAETELIVGSNIREVNISELFIELRKLIDTNKNNIEAVNSVANENSAEISTLRTMISTPYNFKGDVASISALPASGAVNDTYYVQDVKYKVTWTGSAWVQSSLNEADYQTELSELKGDLGDIEANYYSSFGGEKTVDIKYESRLLPNPDGTFFEETSSIQHWFGSGYVEIPKGVTSIKYCAINYNATTITPIAFYDENKNFIISAVKASVFAPVEGVIKVPENAKYFYQSKYYSDGDDRNSNNYTVYIYDKKYDLDSMENSCKFIGYETVEFGEDTFIDENICLVGGSFNKFNGWYSSDYIECNGRNYLEYDSYAFSNNTIDVAYISFFDINKIYISGLKSSDTTNGEKTGKIAIPSNAYYVRGLKAGGNNPFIKLYATGLLNDKDIYDKNLPLTNDMTICCIGDSLTEGIDVGSHKIKESYPYFMGKYLNCDILNYGQKGRTSKTWWENYKDVYSFTSDIDVVLIMFGTNGGLTSNTLATDVEPYTNYNDYADTSVGCYCKLIEYIMEQTENHAQIILLTPPYSTYTEAQEQLVKDTNPVIKAIAERYSLPVIDVFNECGMGKFNADIFRPHDGCHFNAKGYHKLGTFIGSKVKSIISTFDLSDVYDDETPTN